MVFVDLPVTGFTEVTGVTETIPTESTTEAMHTDTTSNLEVNAENMSTEETWLQRHGETDKLETFTILSKDNSMEYETTTSLNFEPSTNYQDFEEEITTEQQTTRSSKMTHTTDIGVDDVSTVSLILAGLEEAEYADETDGTISATEIILDTYTSTELDKISTTEGVEIQKPSTEIARDESSTTDVFSTTEIVQDKNTKTEINKDENTSTEKIESKQYSTEISMDESYTTKTINGETTTRNTDNVQHEVTEVIAEETEAKDKTSIESTAHGKFPTGINMVHIIFLEYIFRGNNNYYRSSK